MALVEGVVGLEALRVVDLGATARGDGSEMVDIRDLPDVVVGGSEGGVVWEEK